MAGDFTALAGGFELFVADGVDFVLAAGEAVRRGDVTDGRMQPLRVVVVDELAGEAFGVFKAQRGFRTEGLLFERFVKALQFAVGLRIVGAGHDVAGLPECQEGFELPAFELRALVAADRRETAGHSSSNKAGK